MQGDNGGVMGKEPTGDDILRLAGWIKGKRVGRNEPCPCGSGKKHKHCHIALQRQLYIQGKEIERIEKARIDAAKEAATLAQS
jgi:hypothetical protein